MAISRPTFVLAAFAAALVALAAPSVASAKKHLPPGSSQLDQYVETLPGPSGGRPAGSAKGGGHSILPPQTAGQLETAGPAGRATANVADASAPEPTKGGPQRQPGEEAGRSLTGSSPSGSGPGQVTNALLGSDSGGGGMGIWLPLILAAIAVAGIGYVLRDRWRNRPAG